MYAKIAQLIWIEPALDQLNEIAEYIVVPAVKLSATHVVSFTDMRKISC